MLGKAWSVSHSSAYRYKSFIPYNSVHCIIQTEELLITTIENWYNLLIHYYFS